MGIDHYDGGEGWDTVDLTAETDRQTIDLNKNRIDFVSGTNYEPIFNIEVILSGSGDDIIITDSNDNYINAGLDNNKIDVIEGLLTTLGNDTIIGGEGTDILSLKGKTTDYSYLQMTDIMLIPDRNNQIKTVSEIEEYWFNDGILYPDSFKERPTYKNLLDGNFSSLEEFLAILRVVANDVLYKLLPDITINLDQIDGFNLGFKKEGDQVDLAVGIGQLADVNFGIQEISSILAEVLGEIVEIDEATFSLEVFDILIDEQKGLGLAKLLNINKFPLVLEIIRGVLGGIDSSAITEILFNSGNTVTNFKPKLTTNTNINSPFKGVGFFLYSTLDNPDTILNESEDGLTFIMGINDSNFKIDRTFSGDNSLNVYSIGFDGKIDLLSILRVLINSTKLVTLPEEFTFNVEDVNVIWTKEYGKNTSDKLNLTIGSISNTEEGLDIAKLFGITDSSSFLSQIIGGIVDTIDGTEMGVNDTTLDINNLSFELNRRYDILSLQNNSDVDYSLNLEINNNEFIWKQTPTSFAISYDGTVDILALIRSLVNTTGLFEISQDFSFNVDGFYVSIEEKQTLLDENTPSFRQNTAEKEVREIFKFGIESISNQEEGLDLAKLFGLTNSDSFIYNLMAGFVDTFDGSEVGVKDTILAINGLDFSLEKIYFLNSENTSIENIIDLTIDIGENQFIWHQDQANFELSYNGTVDIFALLRGFVNSTGLITLPDELALNVNGFTVTSIKEEFKDTFEVKIGSINNNDQGLDLAKMLNLTDTSSLTYQLVESFVDTIDGNDIGINDTVINFNGFNFTIENIYDNPTTIEENESNNIFAFNLDIDDNQFIWKQSKDSYIISYDGTTDILALVRGIANATGLFKLPDTFILNVDGFSINSTKTTEKETLNINIGSISNDENSSVDLAKMFGIENTESFNYRLITTITNTIRGTEQELVKPLIELHGADFTLEKYFDNPETTDIDETSNSLSLNIDIDKYNLIWKQDDNGYEVSYNGTIDVFSLVKFALNETKLLTLPDTFVLNVTGFSVKYYHDNIKETLDVKIGKLSNTNEGLDLAAMFGFTDLNSFGYQLMGGIVDTIDGSEIGVNDTVLTIDGITYKSEKNLDTGSYGINFNLVVGNDNFIWSQSDQGYSISYDGTMDVLAIFKVLLNQTNFISLPDTFTLNIDGFKVSHNETNTQETFNLHLGKVSNTFQGLDLTTMFGLTDKNSFGYQLIGGIVDTFDGTEVGVIDTVLGFNGLDLDIKKNLDNSETEIDFNLLLDNHKLTYTQKSNNDYQLSYDGTIDVLALAQVLINQTEIITLPDTFALNIEGCNLSLTKNDQEQITDFELDINKISKQTIVDLFSSLSLPDFINKFIAAIAGNLQLTISDDLFALNYQGNLDIGTALEAIANGLGINIDLASFTVSNPSLVINKTGTKTNYELSIPEINTSEFITFLVELTGIELSSEIRTKLEQIGDVSLLLNNEGMVLKYLDDIVLDLGEIFSFGGKNPGVDIIIDKIVTSVFGTEELTISKTEFGVTKYDESYLLALKSQINNNELSIKYYDENVTFSYELGDLDFGVLGLGILDGIKINQTELIITTENETITHESLGKINLKDGYNLIGQLDFTQSDSIVGNFIGDYLGIKSLGGHLGISPSSGLSLTGKLVADIPLLTIGDFQLTFKELGLGLDADFVKQYYAVTMDGMVSLAGYDPFQDNEPLLFLNGGLSIDVSGPTLTGFFSLNPETPWINPFGIPDTEIRTLALQIGGGIQIIAPVPPFVLQKPDNFGLIADFRWGTIDIDLALSVDITNPDKIAALLTVNQPVSLTDLILGPVYPFISGINNSVLNNTLDFLDQVIGTEISSLDKDDDGDLDPLFQFAPFATKIAGIPLEQGFGINGYFSAFGASATLSLNADSSLSGFEGSLAIPEIAIKAGDQPILTLSGSSDDTLNLAFKASLSETYLQGDGRLELFGQEFANVDFKLSPTRIDVKELDLNLFEVITLDINDFYLDLAKLSGGGFANLTIFGQTLLDTNFSIENGTKYAFNIKQLGLGNILTLQDVNLNLNFCDDFSAKGSEKVVFLGKEIAGAQFEITETGFCIKDAVIGFGNFASIQIPELSLDLTKYSFVAQGKVILFGVELANADISYGKNQLNVQGGISVNTPFGEIGAKVGAKINTSNNNLTASVGFNFLGHELNLDFNTGNLANLIQSAISQIIGWSPEFITNAVNTAIQGIQSVGNAILNTLSNIYNTVSQFFSDIGDLFSGVKNSQTNSLDNGNNTFDAKNGNDVVYGNGGNDTIFGGQSFDSSTYWDVWSWSNKYWWTQDDYDHIYGQDGNDSLFGNRHNDTLDGGNDNDSLFGGDGDDQLYGQNGADLLYHAC